MFGREWLFAFKYILKQSFKNLMGLAEWLLNRKSSDTNTIKCIYEKDLIFYHLAP